MKIWFKKHLNIGFYATNRGDCPHCKRPLHKHLISISEYSEKDEKGNQKVVIAVYSNKRNVDSACYYVSNLYDKH